MHSEAQTASGAWLPLDDRDIFLQRHVTPSSCSRTMVLFRQHSEASGAVPRLLRVSPLRHSFRVTTSTMDDAAYSSDADSTISVPDFGSQDLETDKKGKPILFSFKLFFLTTLKLSSYLGERKISWERKRWNT